MRAIAVTVFSLLLQATDPYRSEYFSCAGKPDGRLSNYAVSLPGYNGFRLAGDLNFDGREDVILSKSDQTGGSGCGNGGCSVAIYLKQSNGTYRRLDFGLHPEAVGLKMIKPGEGQLVTYWHVSAAEGALRFNKVTSDSITVTDSKLIHTNTSADDKALYSSWFYGDMALKPEYARCMKSRLEWSKSYQ